MIVTVKPSVNKEEERGRERGWKAKYYFMFYTFNYYERNFLYVVFVILSTIKKWS